MRYYNSIRLIFGVWFFVRCRNPRVLQCQLVFLCRTFISCPFTATFEYPIHCYLGNLNAYANLWGFFSYAPQPNVLHGQLVDQQSGRDIVFHPRTASIYVFELKDFHSNFQLGDTRYPRPNACFPISTVIRHKFIVAWLPHWWREHFHHYFELILSRAYKYNPAPATRYLLQVHAICTTSTSATPRTTSKVVSSLMFASIWFTSYLDMSMAKTNPAER